MKTTEKHIHKLLSVLALFLIFGNGALANNSIGLDFHYQVKKNISTFKEPTGDKPFLFDEITIGDASQTITQNENFGLGFLPGILSRSELIRIEVSPSFQAAHYLKDQRKSIYQFLFPFHFFW